MTVQNNAMGGWILTDDVLTGLGSIQEQLSREQGKQYDHIIIEGGVNDVMQQTNVGSHLCVLGQISDSRDPADLDAATFAGALESLFYHATNDFGDAKVGFILTYRPTEQWISDWAVAEEYMALVKQICQKWEVSCLDLWNDQALNDLLHGDTDAYLSDSLHVNPDGYEVLDGYIVDWFQALGTDQEVKDPQTDPTGEPDDTTGEAPDTTEPSNGDKTGGAHTAAVAIAGALAVLAVAGAIAGVLIRRKKNKD